MLYALLVIVALHTEPTPADTPLPLTGLPPAQIVSKLSGHSYRVTTDSAECQAFFNQGLAYLYAQKGPEAAASFETAARIPDPLETALYGEPELVERAQVRAKELMRSLEVDLVSALGATLRFNPNDGD